jgi:hypothetical protein
MLFVHVIGCPWISRLRNGLRILNSPHYALFSSCLLRRSQAIRPVPLSPPVGVFFCTLNGAADFWFPTLNFRRWTRNQKHGVAGVEHENFLRCQRGVSASVVDVVVRNTTAPITTQYYSAFIVDSYVYLDVVYTVWGYNTPWLQHALLPDH